jgi:hypothetical protein
MHCKANCTAPSCVSLSSGQQDIVFCTCFGRVMCWASATIPRPCRMASTSKQHGMTVADPILALLHTCDVILSTVGAIAISSTGVSSLARSLKPSNTTAANCPANCPATRPDPLDSLSYALFQAQYSTIAMRR